jgi:hypothetical protein
MRAKSLANVTLAFGMIVSAGCLDAQERGFAVSTVPTAASGPPNAYVQPFGVPLAPPVYFVNFLLLYWSNPEIAAYMPAYRAALPQEVYQCLVENPLGCPYADMAPFFAEQALASGGGSRNKNTVWPVSCQTDPRWQALAPREYRRADQINEPLGTRQAEQLARALGIDQEMILTDDEYACLIGGPGLYFVLSENKSSFAQSNSPTRKDMRSFPFRVTDCSPMRKEASAAFARLRARLRRRVSRPMIFSSAPWRRLPQSADSRIS